MHDDPAYDVIMRHLGLNENQAYHWVDYIAKLTYGQDPQIYDLKKDLQNLESLDRALNAVLAAVDISAMTQAARNALSIRMLFGPYYGELVDRSGHEAGRISAECRLYSEHSGRKATDALIALEDSASAIRDAIQSTKRYIEQSPLSKKGTERINFMGIQLVNSAREVWRLSTGRDAPAKALNPASKFGRFLCDLFDAFEVEGDPRAAFRTWASYTGIARDV